MGLLAVSAVQAQGRVSDCYKELRFRPYSRVEANITQGESIEIG